VARWFEPLSLSLSKSPVACQNARVADIRESTTVSARHQSGRKRRATEAPARRTKDPSRVSSALPFGVRSLSVGCGGYPGGDCFVWNSVVLDCGT
jgi:hypothetical protein